MILVLGPYIGDFKQECILFRPHCRWLCESLDFDNVYLGTHSNRKFMYEDFIPPENILPVFENISRDEKGQQNYIHSSVSQKDYQIFVKDLKERVQDKENCIKKDMKLYNLSYIKSTPVVSIFKKLFSPVTKGFDIKTEFKDRVVYIPSNTVKKEVHSKVYKFLKRYDVIVVGDGHTRLKSENVVISRMDYFENGYKLIFKILSEARAVICPISFWTTVCNQQEIRVFSWGKVVAQHKPGGIYHLGNEKSKIIWSDSVPFETIENFLEER